MVRWTGRAVVAAYCAAWLGVAAPAPAAAAPQFAPVLSRDFPDPFVLAAGDRYIAYATNGPKGDPNVQVALSSDLRRWRMAGDAMPDLPAWVKDGSTWAPEVLRVADRYLLYFTARHRKSGLQCVGVAGAADPLGPFVATAPEPLVCQFALGGTIDANPFRDADGKLYLYFKNDGNNPAADKPAEIWGQRLSADGLRLEGAPVSLLRNDAAWEGRVVEAPTMARHAAGYTMLFSANDYGWQDHQRLSAYAIGYARCAGPLGPCTDAGDNPLLYSFNSRDAGCLSGPGHQAVFDAGGRAFIAFHAWSATPGCRRLDHRRYMYVAPLGWKDGKPVIGPSLQPVKGD